MTTGNAMYWGSNGPKTIESMERDHAITLRQILAKDKKNPEFKMAKETYMVLISVTGSANGLRMMEHGIRYGVPYHWNFLSNRLHKFSMVNEKENRYMTREVTDAEAFEVAERDFIEHSRTWLQPFRVARHISEATAGAAKKACDEAGVEFPWNMGDAFTYGTDGSAIYDLRWGTVKVQNGVATLNDDVSICGRGCMTGTWAYLLRGTRVRTGEVFWRIVGTDGQSKDFDSQHDAELFGMAEYPA